MAIAKKTKKIAVKAVDPLDAKIAEITKKAEENVQKRIIAQLDNPAYARGVLMENDIKTLDRMINVISEAYGMPIFGGNVFDSITEKLVVIASRLQFAKREVRELIPTEYYSLFTDTTRSFLIEGYGQLPYYRQVTVVEMTDGTKKELDPEAPLRARTGIEAEVEMLGMGVQLICNKMKLINCPTVTQAQADDGRVRALARVERQEKLAQLESEIANAA